MRTAKEIAIYGGGQYGKRLVDYMISIREREKICRILVTKPDEYKYRGIKIQNACSFLEDVKYGQCNVIIAAALEYRGEIGKIVEQYDRKYQYITTELFFELGERLGVPYNGVNFIMAGFAKCGTTSLYWVLRKIPEIYLAEYKESQLFEWKVENPKRKLEQEYLNDIKPGQKVGMIEPSFAKKAERVRDFFGSKVKILFLVRNPVDVVFSKFKMENRCGQDGMEDAYRNGYSCEQIFDKYLEKYFRLNISPIDYAYWITQFEKYFAKEQIKIIFFEELVSNSQMVIADILDFVGISQKYEIEKFLQKNEGSYIMADYEGYKLAKLQSDFIHEILFGKYESIVEKEKKVSEFYKSEVYRKYDQAPKLYDLKITNEQREKLEIYFNNSVRSLEVMTGKDLSTMWF